MRKHTHHSTLKQSDIVVVMPAYNEASYLGRVLKKLNKITTNYVVVDDGSSDETAQIAQKYAKHVLVHKINLGKGAALRTGCEFAFTALNAKAVIFMDSDDQHDSVELELFYTELLSGQELVFGVRDFSHTMPIIKIFGNKVASSIVFLLFGSYIPDIPSGYKAMTKQAYSVVQWQANNYRVELEIAVRAAKANMTFSQIPIKTIYHQHDKGTTLVDVCIMIFHVVLWRIGL